MKRLNSIIRKYNTWPNVTKLEVTYGQKMSKCLLFHAFFIFPQCGDNDTSVATHVATLVITLDTTALDEQ